MPNTTNRAGSESPATSTHPSGFYIAIRSLHVREFAHLVHSRRRHTIGAQMTLGYREFPWLTWDDGDVDLTLRNFRTQPYFELAGHRVVTFNFDGPHLGIELCDLSMTDALYSCVIRYEDYNNAVDGATASLHSWRQAHPQVGQPLSV